MEHKDYGTSWKINNAIQGMKTMKIEIMGISEMLWQGLITVTYTSNERLNNSRKQLGPSKCK